jgi:[CysO sulfur-carrier protein]-S-L-cysteine hydrolase
MDETVGLADRRIDAAFVIPGGIRDEIVAHAVAGLPFETCGLLAGRDGRVERFYPIRNMDQSEFTYQLDPREYPQAVDDIDDRNLQWIGIYHSHTHSPAYPSPTDRAKSAGVQALYPEMRFVLVSLEDRASPSVRAFSIEGDQVTEQAVRFP